MGLMGGSPQEDLGVLVARAEYSYESPETPDYPGMKESIIVRSRIYDLIEQSRNDANRITPRVINTFNDITKKIGAKIEELKKQPAKIAKRVKIALAKIAN